MYVNMHEGDFINRYSKQLTSSIKTIYPELSDDELKQILDIAMEDKIDKEDNIKFRINNNYKHQSVIVSMDTIIDTCVNGDSIITGSGTLYRNQEKATSMANDMIKDFITNRNESRNLMYKYKELGDTINENRYSNEQQTIKILNNSFYGVTAEPNSQFYNPYVAESITYTGVQAITTAIMSFEAFLTNNIKHKNMDELILFITRIINEDYNIMENINKIITKDHLYNYITKKIIDFEMSDDDKDTLKYIINNLDENDINKIYYKNQLYKFMRNDKPLELLGKILDHRIINLKTDIDDELNDIIEELWEMVRTGVVYRYQTIDRYDKSLNDTRKAVLVIDTDSNFVSLDRWFNFVKEEFNIDTIDDDDFYFTIANSALSITTRFIEYMLEDFTSSAKVLPEEGKRLVMDNEYFYKRLMTTRNKKQYVGRLSLQEGVKIIPEKIDMKGLAIKKVNVSKRTEEFFTELIHDDILTPEKIDLKYILNKYDAFSNEIKESLKRGEVHFLTPATVNDPSGYVTPYQMPQVRGVFAYNYLNPDFPIQYPATVRQLKIKGSDIKELEPIYNEPEFEILQDKIFNSDNKELAKYGVTMISLPLNEVVIPEWIRPVIDYDTIVSDNIRSGILLLESLGFHIMEYRNREHYSNLIKL